MDQPEELEEGEVAGEEMGPESQELIALKQKKKAKKAKTRQVGDKVASPPESRASTTDSVEKIEKKVKLDKPYAKKNKNEFVSSTYKTRPCEFYRKGACQKGDDCTYSHDLAMGKPDTVCKFYLTGNCSKGDGCMFSHDLKKYPCKFFWGTGNCTQGIGCRFSHEPMRDEQKIMDFIEENEEFFMSIYQRYNRTNMGQYFLNYLQKKNAEQNKDNKSQFLLLPPGQEPAPFFPPGQQNQFPNQHPNQPPGLGHPPFTNPPQQGFDPNNPNNPNSNIQPNMQPNMPPSMHPMQYNNPQGNQQFPGKPGFYDQNAMAKPRFMQPPPPTQNFQGKPMPIPGHQSHMPGHPPSGPGPNQPYPYGSMPPGQGFQPQNPQFNPQNQYNQGPMNQMNQGGQPMYQQPNPVSQGPHPHPHLHPHLNQQMQMQQQQQQQQPQMQPPQMQQPGMQPPHMQVQQHQQQPQPQPQPHMQQQQQQYPPQQPQIQQQQPQMQPQMQAQTQPQRPQPQPQFQPQPQHQPQPQLQQIHMQQPPMQMHPQLQPHMHQQQQQFPPQQLPQQQQIPPNQMHQPSYPQNTGAFPTPQKIEENKDFIPFNSEPAPQFRPNTFPPNPQPVMNQFAKGPGPQDHIGAIPDQQLPPNDPRRRLAQQSVTKNIPNMGPNMGPPIAQFENMPQKDMPKQVDSAVNNPFLMSRGASQMPNQMPNMNLQPPQHAFQGNIGNIPMPVQTMNRSDIKPEEIKQDKGLNDSFIPFGNVEPKREMTNIRMDDKPPAPPMMGQNFPPKETKAPYVPVEIKQNIEPRKPKMEYSKPYGRQEEETPTKRNYMDLRRPSKKSTVPAPNMRTKTGTVLTPTRSRAQSGQFTEEKSSQRMEKEREYFNQNALLQKLGISKKKELNKVEAPGDIEKLFSTFEFYSDKTVTPLKSSKEQVSTSINELLKSLKEVLATE